MKKNEPVFGEESKGSFDAEILNAVLSVPGVSEVTKCAASNINASSPSQDKSEYDLELRLAVEYGSSIPAIHKDIRKRLKEDVQAVTGLEVKKLNLCIEDIHGIPYE